MRFKKRANPESPERVRLGQLHLGQTRLGDGERVSKGSDMMAALGSLDELNAFLGLLKSSFTGETRVRRKNSLVVYGAGLAGEEILAQIEDWQRTVVKLSGLVGKAVSEISLEEEQSRLEAMRLKLRKGMAPPSKFILPGKSFREACWHLARTVCRRAERDVCRLLDRPVSLSRLGPVSTFLNRLSEVLWLMSLGEK
ncbi:MAG: ATP:cob(I)alamin adenosyltransferase [Puniceicoccales bacterium]|jgi:cob(I)alamin adenosyltransferase|nr:ATP:cob(I)alamin adenosyltransferase [Puniceicoccales bacterium]